MSYFARMRKHVCMELIIELKNKIVYRGGEIEEGSRISPQGFCGEGYEGVACATCAPGYAKFGSRIIASLRVIELPHVASETCFNCETNKAYYVKFAFYLLIQTSVIILAVKYPSIFFLMVSYCFLEFLLQREMVIKAVRSVQ